MDAPETVDPNEPVESYGPKASAFTEGELEGRAVTLRWDQDRKDELGRLLAYVYLDGRMFNETLVEQGYAEASPYKPNTRYEYRFEQAEDETQAAGRGMWGATASPTATAT